MILLNAMCFARETLDDESCDEGAERCEYGGGREEGREGVPGSIRGGNCLILSGFYQSEGHREIGHRRDL
jgi:hypothetical protein